MSDYLETPINLNQINENISKLVLIMEQLRNKEGGCDWDLQQTYETIAPYTIEEAYEVVEAIYDSDMDKLCDELGDLLLQVISHSQIARERGDFQLQDVISAVCDKMIRRHPHVFGEIENKNVLEVRKTWEDIKQLEREQILKYRKSNSLMDGISATLPALTRAMKLQQRAAKVGFDWPTIYPAFDKMYEEIEELKLEIEADNPDRNRIQAEVGDILFVATNIARIIGYEPETSLILTNRKFEKRFRQMELQSKEDNENLEDLSIDELESYWVMAKNIEKNKS